MIKVQLFVGLVFLLLFIMPLAGAVIEEDWSNYIRVNGSKRDDKGQDITLNMLRRNYSNPAEKYTLTAQDFDAQGSVVLVINYKGRNETVWLSGTWNENRTKFILPEPIEAFDKTMIITPLKIVAPVGVFTCCPEVQININLVRPELFLEFDEDTDTTSDYSPVNPYASWNISVDPDSPYKSPFDNGSIESGEYKVTDKHSAYRIHDEIPMEISVINYGDVEAENPELYIDTGGLLFESGKTNYPLPTLAGKDQKDFNGEANQTIKLKLKFPENPDKINYTVHAYIKGVKNNNVYYYDDTKTITLLPSIGIQKSVTKESVLIDREDITNVYPSVDPDEITRWLQSADTYVTLGVTNYQSYEIKKIKLSDTIPRQFIIENNSLNWTFDLKPGGTKEFTYRILTNRPGRYSLPSALLSYSDMNMTWNLTSNSPSTEVHGSCIQIFKKSDKPVIIKGNNTNITVTVRNSGDMPSKVAVNDSLPENSTLLKGQMYYEGNILPKESALFSYMISMDYEGQVELPNPILYVNGRESPVCGELSKSIVSVQRYNAPKTVKTLAAPKKTPVEVQKTVEAPRNLNILAEYSWLEGVVPAFMLILAVIVFFMLNRKNI